jgi:hypothetical protein
MKDGEAVAAECFASLLIVPLEWETDSVISRQHFFL